MIKLVHKQGNISLTAPTGYKQSEVNEMLAAQEKRLEAEYSEEINVLNKEIDDLEEQIEDLEEQIIVLPVAEEVEF